MTQTLILVQRRAVAPAESFHHLGINIFLNHTFKTLTTLMPKILEASPHVNFFTSLQSVPSQGESDNERLAVLETVREEWATNLDMLVVRKSATSSARIKLTSMTDDSELRTLLWKVE